MGHPSVQKATRKYSWDDYLAWPDDERWEIINGVAYNITPAPSIRHQTVAGNFFSLLKQKLSGKTCKPFIAPVDVAFSEHDIVQPDVFVLCDKSKITETHIKGAPNLIVEVLLPSTSLKDLREKKNLYEKSGVKEYIIVDPLEKNVERFLLSEEGGYSRGEVFGTQEALPLKSLEGIEIYIREVFEGVMA